MRRVLPLVATLAFLPALSSAQVPQVPRGNTLKPELERIQRHYNNGWALLHSEDWDGAVKEFQTVIELKPDFSLAYYSLGKAEMGRKHFHEAVDAYLKCKEVYAASGAQNFSDQLNGVRKLQDQIDELQIALTQAQTVKQSSPSQQQYISDLRNKINYLQQSHDRQQDVTIDTSVPYFVPMALGAAYFRLNRMDAAEAEYKAALAENSASGETHNNLAVLYMMTGRLQEAQAQVKLAEKNGVRVNQQFKEDLDTKLKASR
jgi:tetratricopeptide (TPR) repeat protein